MSMGWSGLGRFREEGRMFWDKDIKYEEIPGRGKWHGGFILTTTN